MLPFNLAVQVVETITVAVYVITAYKTRTSEKEGGDVDTRSCTLDRTAS